MPRTAPSRTSPVRERSWTTPLAFALFHELAARPGNLLFSPYGLVGALMVIHAGAAGGTRREVEAILHRRGTGDTLVDAFGKLLRRVGRLVRSGNGLLELLTGNALWCQAGCPVRQDFIDTLRARLGAEAGEVDFAGSPDEAARTINAWSAESTGERIPALLDERQAGSLTHGMLANVVSFVGPWIHAFVPEATHHGQFHLASGRRVDVPMMHRRGTHLHARVGRVEAIQVRHVVPRIRTIVLLPRDGPLANVEQELCAGLYREVLRQARPRRACLALPRFRLESTLRLRSALEGMGLHEAFSPHAELSRISEREGVCLDDVLQRTVLEVGERGAETVASPGTRALGPPPEETAELLVDRPFLLLVGDTESETLFFVGRVVDPRET